MQRADVGFVFCPEQRRFGTAEAEGVAGVDNGAVRGMRLLGLQAGGQVDGDDGYGRAVDGGDEAGVGFCQRAVGADAKERVNEDAAGRRGKGGEVSSRQQALQAGGVGVVVGAAGAVLRAVHLHRIATHKELAGDDEAIATVVTRPGDYRPVMVVRIQLQQFSGAAAGGARHQLQRADALTFAGEAVERADVVGAGKRQLFREMHRVSRRAGRRAARIRAGRRRRGSTVLARGL